MSFLPIVLPFMFLPIVAIVPVAIAETKLFSDKPDKVNFQPAKSVPLTKTPPRTPLTAIAVSLCLIGGGFSTFYAISLLSITMALKWPVSLEVTQSCLVLRRSPAACLPTRTSQS